jgi:hypothetical protein
MEPLSVVRVSMAWHLDDPGDEQVNIVIKATLPDIASRPRPYKAGQPQAPFPILGALRKGEHVLREGVEMLEVESATFRLYTNCLM